MKESAIGWFEISSAHGINPIVFTLISGRPFRQGQRAATSSPKLISRSVK